MFGELGRGQRSDARFEGRCAWCGPVMLEPAQIVLHVGPRGAALFEFACPSCQRLNLRGVEMPEVVTLLAAGVSRSRGPAPFELLEEREGPPIGWDDLIDFHQALVTNAEWKELRAIGRGLAGPGEERDAA